MEELMTNMAQLVDKLCTDFERAKPKLREYETRQTSNSRPTAKQE